MVRASYCLVLVLGIANVAHAQRRRAPHEAPVPVDEATERAREAYDRGQAQFREGQFAAALSSFEAAYAAKPHPVVLVSIAECQERLGELRAAVESLTRYLSEAPNAPDAASIEQRIAELRARPARVSVRSEPSGATILLDGADTGRQSPSEIEMPAGTHVIVLRLEGRNEATQELTVELAEARELALTLTPSAREEPAPEPPPRAAGPESSEGRGALWISAGITGMGLVAGTVLGFLALSDKSEFDSHPTVEVADRGERFALFSDIAFGVAIAAGVTTAVLVLTDSPSRQREGLDEGTESARLEPLVLRSGAGLSARLSF